MKKVSVVLLSAVPLSGCSSLANIDGGHEVDCSARFDLQAFGNQGYVVVKIDRMKTDHFRRVFYRPQSNLNLNFIGGGFKPAELFRDIECEK
ncbi:hypothetical protein [Enterobacter hormaechei]|uniref:hypothetical protein n=1 Tax=Enterobacter hormaechei TaxID=158836 RepID=UPI003F41D386